MIMKTFPDLIEKFDVIDTKADGCITKSELIASEGAPGFARTRRCAEIRHDEANDV